MTQAQSELSKLLGHWTERDNRYSKRKIKGVLTPLTDSEADSVRAFRRSETTDLVDTDQRLARMALSRWTPPATMR